MDINEIIRTVLLCNEDSVSMTSEQKKELLIRILTAYLQSRMSGKTDY